MLIVKLAMLYEGVFALKKMVTSTAFATRLGWSISPGMPWSVSPGMGGQLAPEWSGHIHQNLQQTAANNELAAVTIEQLNQWKAEHKVVHIIRMKKKDESQTLTAYFKKADINTITECIELSAQKKIDELFDFLLSTTFLGGDKEILTDLDFSLMAGVKLWNIIAPLPAGATTY